MTDREEFLEIFRTHVTRPGSEKLLDWMDSKTDFFSAPASTRFHGACEGGLCAHSLNVYRVLHGTFFTPDEDSEETFAICALLHDLCKANFYKKGTRNVKNEATGQWEKVPSYSVEDMFPYGDVELDGERVLLEGPRQGKAAAPDGVVEAAHVPADGHGFFHLQLHEPLDEEDAFLAMAVREHVLHAVAGDFLPLARRFVDVYKRQVWRMSRLPPASSPRAHIPMRTSSGVLPSTRTSPMRSYSSSASARPAFTSSRLFVSSRITKKYGRKYPS